MKAYSYEEKKATAHIGMIGTNVLILFAFSLLAGILFCEFVCHQNITIYQGLVLVCCCVVISFLWYFLKRKVHHPFLIGSAGICLLSLTGGVFWWNGALQTINGILQWYSKRTGNLAEEYAVSDRFVAVGTVFFCKQSVTAFLMVHTIFSGSSERTGHGYRYASVLSGRIFLWKAFCDNVCDRIVDSIFILSA